MIHEIDKRMAKALIEMAFDPKTGRIPRSMAYKLGATNALTYLISTAPALPIPFTAPSCEFDAYCAGQHEGAELHRKWQKAFALEPMARNSEERMMIEAARSVIGAK